ncbi:MAG: transcriptional regulator [Gammaproteobacteria bacterium]|nr:MAG: transcriptional regulator [Gammaproteobacteria bacterium]
MDTALYTPGRLKQLRAFVEVAQTESVSAAAARLNLSQPSISLQIKALETAFGTPLFERRGPRIRITPAGRALLELAQPLVERLERLPELFAARLGDAAQGHLDIAAGEATILYILPRFVEAFKRAHPGVKLNLRNVTGRHGLTLLRRNEVDFAVGSLLERVADMDYYPIFTFDPVLITPPEHPLARIAAERPLTLEDIGPHGLILPPRHLSTWSLVKLVFQQHNVPYHVTMEAGGWEVIKKYVELGLGVSIVTSVCLTGGERLAVIPLDRYFPKRTYGVVLRRGRLVSPQARRFLEIMDPAIGEWLDGLGAAAQRA